MKETPYILILESDASVLNLQLSALSCFYGGEVRAFGESHHGISCLEANGHPEMIIIDSKMMTESDSQFCLHLEANNIAVPLIVTGSTTEADIFFTKYLGVADVIEKPLSSEAFTYLIKNFSSVPHISPSHVPVKISVLLRMGMRHFDLFLKLSEINFVKLFHKGEPFYDSDAEKLVNKGIYELYIKKEDSKDFLTFLENEILGIEEDSESDIPLTLQNLEAFEKIAKRIGWSPEVLSSAQKSVIHAVKILSKNQNIMSMLKNKLKDQNTAYGRHIGLMTYLVCAFSSSLGWIGESGQTKLALAALLHDAAVDESYYENLKEWNKRARDPTDKDPAVIKYRMHPLEASKIVRSIHSLSPDVDQIVLQHHETKSGSGFPRGIDASRIGHLPALFIIVETMVDFIDDGENIDTSITDFITWGRAIFDRGHFKKVFSAFEEKLKP